MGKILILSKQLIIHYITLSLTQSPPPPFACPPISHSHSHRQISNTQTSAVCEETKSQIFQGIKVARSRQTTVFCGHGISGSLAGDGPPSLGLCLWTVEQTTVFSSRGRSDSLAEDGSPCRRFMSVSYIAFLSGTVRSDSLACDGLLKQSLCLWARLMLLLLLLLPCVLVGQAVSQDLIHHHGICVCVPGYCSLALKGRTVLRRMVHHRERLVSVCQFASLSDRFRLLFSSPERPDSLAEDGPP